MTATAEGPVATELPAEDRWSRWVFVAGAVVAVPVLVWIGRDQWFFLDEWAIVTDGGLTSPGLLDAHNGHWVTLLRFEYRLNFRVFGLSTYVPYLVPVVVAHVGSAVLLRLVMLRVGVRGWLASGVALAFVFFGPGRDNIVWGFQVTMAGSLLAGLAVLLIADHTGPIGRRDALGLVVGMLGLMTSSLFLAMAAGVGVAVLVRRGSRVAGFYTVPLGVVYAIWYLLYGRDTGEPMTLTGDTLRFGARMFGAVFTELGRIGPVGVLLAAVAAVGVVSTVAATRRTGDRQPVALLAGLLVAWLAFALLTSVGRANDLFTADSHDASRYVHVGAALLLPAVAAGIDAFATWRPLAGAVAAGLLVVGVPGNFERLGTSTLYSDGADLFGPGSRDILAVMARSPHLDDLSTDQPVWGAIGDLGITVGWLARSAETGQVPSPDDPTVEQRLAATAHLVLAQVPPSGSADASADGCVPVTAGEPVVLTAGDEVRFDHPILVAVTDGTVDSRPRWFAAASTSAVRALTGPVDVRVWPEPGDVPLLCAAAGAGGSGS